MTAKHKLVEKVVSEGLSEDLFLPQKNDSLDKRCLLGEIRAVVLAKKRSESLRLPKTFLSPDAWKGRKDLTMKEALLTIADRTNLPLDLQHTGDGFLHEFVDTKKNLKGTFWEVLRRPSAE